ATLLRRIWMVMASISRPRQNHVAITIDPRTPGGRDEGGGVELLDDGRAFDRRVDVETRALVERRLHRRSVERDRASALNPAGGAAGRRAPRRARARRPSLRPAVLGRRRRAAGRAPR